MEHRPSRSDRLQVYGLIAFLLIVGVAYMLHRINTAVVNAWDDATEWVKAHQFWSGFIAGVLASVVIVVLL